MHSRPAIILFAGVASSIAIAAAPAQAASASRTVTTRATPRIESGTLQLTVKTARQTLCFDLSFSVDVFTATRVTGTVTPCSRSGGVLRCSRARRATVDIIRLRRGRNHATRSVRLSIPGRGVTCARFEIREIRPGTDTPLLRKVRGSRRIDLCAR